MAFKALNPVLLALTAIRLVAAQTFTECDPLKKDCPPDAALGDEVVHCDFTKGPCDSFFEADYTTIEYGNKGAVFKTEKAIDAPTLTSKKYIFFGRVDVELQAVQGNGIVTSVVLESDDLDEIDLEWVGSDNENLQSQYFGKADPSSYGKGGFHEVSDPLTTFHTYSVEWTQDAVNWIVDGITVRTLKYLDAHGGKLYPQTPMQVKLGTWCAGGEDTAEGTREWAGGYTDFSKGPYVGYYKSVTITDYAGKSTPAKESIKEYVYGDKSGTWESINIVKSDDDDDDKNPETVASAASTEAFQSATSIDRSSLSQLMTTAPVASTTAVGAETTSTNIPISATTTPSTTFTKGDVDNPASRPGATVMNIVLAAFLLAQLI